MNPTAASGPELRDIHLPPAPGWWPPAPGWWLLAFAVLAVLGWCALLLYRSWRRRRYRRAVMRELDRCIDSARGDPAALATVLSAFLRRLSRRGDATAAALAGEAWLDYLDRGAASEEFTRGIGRALVEAPFRPLPQYDTVALIALVRRWTRRSLESGVAHA